MHRYSGWFHGLCCVVLLFAAGCGSGGDAPSANIEASPAASPDQPGGAGLAQPNAITPLDGSATIDTSDYVVPEPEDVHVVVDTSLGEFTIKLIPKKAPISVDNFLRNYADKDFYTDTIFHFVDDTWMIAAGGFDSKLQAKPTLTPIANEANNGLTNKRGTVAMARHPDFADSATSQFFINLVDNSKDFDYSSEKEEANGYCVIGEVVKGMDVVDKIAAVKTHDTEEFEKIPVELVTIRSIRRAR